MAEDRLRELLRDPQWALPAWPDARGRVRRAVRRQRLRLAGVGAAVTAVVTAAAMVPVVLLTGTAGGPGGRGGVVAVSLPALGAPGFPVTIYPAALRARIYSQVLPLCPAPAGLRLPGGGDGAAALVALRRMGRNVAVDLHLSDRAAWPKAVTENWARRVTVAAQQPIVYSGPLQAYQRAAPPTGHPSASRLYFYRALRRVGGQQRVVSQRLSGQQQKSALPPAGGGGQSAVPPPLRQAVAAGCGARVVRDTWVIVSRRPASPAGPAGVSETLFVDRRGRVLLYNSE
jgi:hypothetical protein